MISRPAGSAAPSHTETTTETESNGSFQEKVVLTSRKRVCCGIPIWMFVVTGIVLILGTVIGGVIGGVLGSKAGGGENDPVESEAP